VYDDACKVGYWARWVSKSRKEWGALVSKLSALDIQVDDVKSQAAELITALACLHDVQPDLELVLKYTPHSVVYATFFLGFDYWHKVLFKFIEKLGFFWFIDLQAWFALATCSCFFRQVLN
jgi:hypothetical protein